MKATAKTRQKPASRQQRERAAARLGTTKPNDGRSCTGLIAVLAAAGTLWAAAPLWPGPSSRVTAGSALFLAAVGVVCCLVARTAVEPCRCSSVPAGVRNAVLLVLLVVVPSFFDLRVLDSYNLPKFTVTMIGALAIAAVWMVEVVRPASRVRWRNGLHWPVLALLGWTAVTTATSVSPRMSILGAMGTNDGLLAAAAFAVIFFAVAQGVTLEHVKASLSVLYFGAGGLIVLYGLVQLHDRLFPGPPLDWLRHVGGAGTRDFANGGIFSTFGNPNYLGGFLAVLVPVGLALLMVYSSRRIRILTLAIMTGVIVELLQTASRGALFAALVSFGVAGALLWPDVRRRPAVSVRAVGTLTASVMIAALALAVVPESSAKFSSVLDVGATLSIRTAIWETGLAMANGRPLLGHGPDTWTDRVSKYRNAENIARHGPGVFSNSAHNIFIGQLAGTGYPGLMLLLALLAYAAMRAVGTWRRLQQIEADGRDDQATRARAARLLLVAVVGGLVAYIVQASFNVSQIGLSFVFWVLLGLLGALSLAAGVPVGLRPRALVRRPPAPERFVSEADGKARLWAADGTDADADLATGAIAVLACIGLLLGVSVASRPLRADHNAWAARLDSSSAANAPPERAERLGGRATVGRANAIHLNPWEPTYQIEVADGYFALAFSLPDRSPTQVTALHQAGEHYLRAIALRPHTVAYLKRYADVLLKIHDVDPAGGNGRSEAIRALRRAVSADPASTDARERLRAVLGD